MIVVLAEKPSVARSIAKQLGANNQNEGYISGNGYCVTWAFGHLITLAQPFEYGFKSFEQASLPMLPDIFKLVPRQIRVEKKFQDDPGALKQLKVIEKLFNESSEIIVATDAGREGELIFRYIYDYLHCKAPFKRLWISSLTEKGIAEGFKHLKPGNNYDNLFYSARARSQSDWLVGMNASQALTIAAAGQGVYSLGRVQTPVLKMICERFNENRNFKPQTYFQLKINAEKNNTCFFVTGTVKYDNREEAEKVNKLIVQTGKLNVKTVEKKEVQQEPPLLFDLTALQREANNRLGFSADRTLSIAQSLYEKRLITYPRTGSRFISDDVFEEIPGLISNLENHPSFCNHASNLKGQPLNNKSVNTERVTDHHALLITETKAGNFENSDEEAIYNLIAARMLEAFGAKCIKEVVTLNFEAAGVEFSTKGTVIKVAGWKAVHNEPEEGEEQNNLPPIAEGETLQIQKTETLEKKTKPRPLHTDASLLASMEAAGKELQEEERAALKDIGIGTPATRAAVIETLLLRQYVRREKKNLIPTERGQAVYDIVKNMRIADVAMTAAWETALSKIESGEMNADTFHKGIEVYTAQITAELLKVRLNYTDDLPACICPKCKEGKVLFFPKVVKCNDPNCGFIVFRSKSEKTLSDKQIINLIEKGKTEIIKGFKNRDGKTFEAGIKFDERFNVVFDFPPKQKK